jgi:hypothetical protein
MMESRIDHLVFWAGSVVLTPLWRAAWDALAPSDDPTPRSRQEMHGLERALYDGKLSPEEFCRTASEVSMSAVAAGDLLEKLPEHVAPIHGMPEVVSELSRKYQLSLASDYPCRWLAPALERAGLSQWFSLDQAWIVAEGGGFPRVLDALLEQGKIHPGRTLWVDVHSLRTSAALRRGIDAAVFVHARQFYRDLGLWGLVPFPGAVPARS